MSTVWNVDSGEEDSALRAAAHSAAVDRGMKSGLGRCLPCHALLHSDCVVEDCGCSYCLVHEKHLAA